jgi:molybdopterin molybdotransferase
MAGLSVPEAQARVLADIEPVAAETVALAAARNRILAAPITARRTQPPFDASAMDGYAVRAADAGDGAELTVVGAVQAGARFEGRVGPGEAVRIFTGAPVPDGADAILVQEHVETLDGGRIRAVHGVAAGRHVRRRGTDFSEGRDGLAAGLRLDWRRLALAAAFDHPTLAVRRPVRVAVLATGDELVPPGAPMGPASIVASNGYGVAALVEALGAEVLDLGIAPDRHEAIAARVSAALAADVDILVTLGGASVGQHDLIKPVLAEAGMDLGFWRVAMRPGKPLVFGRLGPTRVLGLPGNPVSSLVSAKLFLEPLVRALFGEPEPLPRTRTVAIGVDRGGNDERADYLRVRLVETDGHVVALPVDNQDSSLLTRFAGADALWVRPPNAPPITAGSPVPIIPLAG